MTDNPAIVIDPETQAAIDAAQVPSDINPEPGAPPTIEELALRLSEARGEVQILAAKFAKLCDALNVKV